MGRQLLTFFALVCAVSAQMDDVGLAFTSLDSEATANSGAPYEPLASSIYAKVMQPTLRAAHLEDLPGFTRSVLERDHALISVESQVFGPLPGWTNTLAAYFITPALGAHFTMYLAHMAGNSTSGNPSQGAERFMFVVSGEVLLEYNGSTAVLGVDAFAYAPVDEYHEMRSAHGAAVVVIERTYTLPSVYESEHAPTFHVGSCKSQPVIPVAGEVFVLRKLLPASSAYDFNIHVMDFQPGEFLNVKEVHYNQHGLLLLEGRGIYRLRDKWYPVQAGDVIWMAPFVPQWYAALGKSPSRYLLYKDTGRDPLSVL